MTEMGLRETGRPGHVLDPQVIGITSVGQILGPEQLAGSGGNDHSPIIGQGREARGIGYGEGRPRGCFMRRGAAFWDDPDRG